MKKKVNIVVPCYNEEKCIVPFYNEINNIFKTMKMYIYEIIFVVDPSLDNSFEIIKKLSLDDKKVKYIFMTNRYGKEASMLAGLNSADGDYVCIMDVDLQDPPKLLKEMIKILETEEYDSVATRRVDRKGEPFLRSIFSNIFYKLINKISKLDLKSGARDFRLMNKRFVQHVLLSNEKNRFLKAIYSYTGYKTKWLEYENIPRKNSKSKWSFLKLFNYSLTCIFGFTNFPLIIVGIIGMLCIFISFILLLINIVYFIFTNSFFGIIYSFTNIICFFSGVQIFCMSILCYYLYSIYVETRNRPLYIILETNIETNIKS